MAGNDTDLQNSDRHQELQLELEAVQAIYEEDLSFETCCENTDVRINLADSDTLLVFFLHDKYPDEIPSIKVLKDGAEWTDKLEVHLNQKAKKIVGTAMIFTLIEEAKEWISQNQNFLTPSSSKAEEQSISDSLTQPKNICHYFLEGKCKFGDKCFNKHIVMAPQCSNQDLDSLHANMLKNSPTKLSHHSNTPSSSEASCALKSKELRKSSENSKTKKNELTNKNMMAEKKKPMKTAADVISRIQWDEHLSENDFVVGYLDRFVGIIEKKFTEFSWEDIASVDYNTLAIPQHRIQYFKYKGEIVWDKRERLDLVFGSTGNGETILQVLARHKHLPIVEQKTQVCIQDFNKADTCKEQISNDVDDISDDDDDDDDDDAPLISHATKLNKHLETGGPNYFIALPVRNSSVIAKIQELQKEVTKEDASFDNAAVPTQRLHVTLLTLTLSNEDEERNAKQVLKGLQPLVACLVPPSHSFSVHGVGMLRHRILYAGVKQNPLLKKLTDILKYKLSQAGISLDGNREVFFPHVTIFKAHPLNRNALTDIEQKYVDYTFGEQHIETIELCSKFGVKNPDGSFHSIFTAKNSILTLSSSLTKKLLKRLEALAQEKKLKPKTEEKINNQLNSGEALSAEEALKAMEILAPEENRVLFIVRGIPGCGKTHLIENCTESKQLDGFAVLANTLLFQKADNISVDLTELSISETYCRIRFLESLDSGVPVILLDGVHSQRWEYAMHQRLARVFGYRCQVIEISCVDSATIKLCHKYCRSEVSLEQLTSIVDNWENDPDAIIITPWFSKAKRFQGQPVTLTQLVK